jgi:hypothetical protein
LSGVNPYSVSKALTPDTNYTVAVNGSASSPNESSIFNFSDGTDKIRLVGFGFTSSGSPGLITGSDDTFPTIDGTIKLIPSADQVVIYLNGVGTEDYAKVTVTGVTTLDLTDFEFG